MQILIGIAPFLMGVFEEYISALVSLCLLAFIVFTAVKNNGLTLKKDPVFIVTLLFEACFLLSPLWAVDKGMTLLGFVKFLPLPLFTLMLLQDETHTSDDYLKFIPHSGAVMTVLAFVLSRFSKIADLFLVRGRLAGFFQYSNTYAVFLLVGLVILMFKKKRTVIDAVIAAVLVGGIFLSGSRTVFVLFVLVAILFVILEKNKKIKFISLAAVALAIVVTAVYAAVTGNYDVAGRYLTSSLQSSTFVGRFLYYSDALPQILRHPLGMGYYGYRTLQGSFQTGVYSVVHIHNDLLQILLDIGWIPAVAAVAVVVIRLKSGMKLKETVMLFVLILHALFDFDLQFIAIDFILLVLLARKAPHEKAFSIKKTQVFIGTVILALTAVYFGTADVLFYAGRYDAAAKFCPLYTDALVEELKASEAEDFDVVSDKILALNKSCSLAYSAKARAAFSSGDIALMMEYKTKAIELNRYSLNEYLDYIDMLRVAASLFVQAGDDGSASYCVNEILNVVQRIDAVKNGTSDLGWKINDKPELDLPPEYQELIDLISQG